MPARRRFGREMIRRKFKKQTKRRKDDRLGPKWEKTVWNLALIMWRAEQEK